MLNRKTMIGVWLAAALYLTGCAGPWARVPQRLCAPQWSISPPSGWMQLQTSGGEMLSKDGPFLEYILIQSRPLAKGFRHTKQKLSADMLPDEAARIIADNLRSDPLIRQFRLQASEPAMVGGFSGFKLTYSYLDQNGVRIKTVSYGAVLPHMYFNLCYTATQRYYFDQELPAFMKVLDSLRLVST